jgi:hypothetical protein
MINRYVVQKGFGPQGNSVVDRTRSRTVAVEGEFLTGLGDDEAEDLACLLNLLNRDAPPQLQ